MPTLLAPVAIQQFKDNNGNPLISGQLFTYVAGTSTPQPSYTDATGTSANTNPVILNSRGEAPLWLIPGQFYKLVLLDASGVLIWTADQVPGGFVDGSGQIRTDFAAGTGSSLIGFSGLGAGAVPRTLQSKLRDFPSILDFMTPAQTADYLSGAASLDLTAPIQAACNAGGLLYFPAGKARVTATINITLSIEIKGAGRGKSFIVQDTDFDVFYVANFQTGWGIEKINIKNRGAAAASGAGINIYTAANGVINDVYLEGVCYGVSVNTSQATTLTKVDVWYFKGQGIRIAGTNNDVFISRCFINGENPLVPGTSGTGTGIRLENKAEAIIFDSCEVVLCNYALSTDATSNTLGTRPAYCRFTNCFFDSSTNGVSIDKSADFTFTGCWFSNRPADGCIVGPNVTSGITFNGCTFANSAKNGCLVQNGTKRTVFIGCKFFDNATSAANTYSGLNFAAGATDFTVIGCTSGSVLGFSNNQQYGIALGVGCDRFVLRDNGVLFNATAGILDSTVLGTDKIIAGNTGFKTASAGSAIILSGTTTITVSPGLSVTPQGYEISLTRGGGNAGSSDLYVSGITATQFTINVSPAPSANMPVYYTVRTLGA